MEDRIKKIAFVVLSCDPYSDLWECYGLLFNRYWPDCPFDCYMASHTIEFDKFSFKPILLGEDLSWSHGLIVLLDILKSKGYEYAMIAFDDLILYENVDNDYIITSIEHFLNEDGNCLRFVTEKAPKCYKHNQYYGEMAVKAPYRVTLGFAIWKIDVLKHITVEGESAWQFEKNATERSFDYDKFFCTKRSPFNFLNLVVKRKIDVKEFERLKKKLPNATFEREQVYVKEEKYKDIFLNALLKYCPIKLQYPIYNYFTKPINL